MSHHVQDALHPTPAVCGRPQDTATRFLQEHEPFDRGFYAGPFGILSASTSEFVVGIRSALITRDPPTPSARPAVEQTAYLYAGVGVVVGSNAADEWAELDLKVMPVRRILPPPPPLHALPNDNAVWARLIIDELVRSGVSAFAVAPGSRSSALTHAAAQHAAAACTVCIDERSLGFWALGHARATGAPAAIITTSGTAVANLLPAVVEASMSATPMLVLSADRPGELRATGANQTIDQVHIFGRYVRHAVDLQPPGPHVSGAAALTTIDAAMRHAMSATNPGPVHVNCQFRDPLAPVAANLDPGLVASLGTWEGSTAPFTTHAAPAAYLPAPAPPELRSAMRTLRTARRGLIVVGELHSTADQLAALALADTLGWPLAAGILSGLRTTGTSAAADQPPVVVHHLDAMLTDAGLAAEFAPDCILQLGSALVSKRVSHFLRAAAQPADGAAGAPWLLASLRAARRDEHHCVTAHLALPPAALLASLREESAADEAATAACAAYAARIAAADRAAARSLHATVLEPANSHSVTEPAVAMTVAAHLPVGHALFVGNSMPIRHLDMYASFPRRTPLSPPVACNRGASGIDGVVSCATGFAAGLEQPTTLLIGDVSFLHDANGLLLLSHQVPGAALTVVVVNNGGGGIFHFLPIHDAVEEDEFTSMWATPANVDLKGLCRAHGIAFQQVDTLPELEPALRSAWALSKSSVVEIVANRADAVAVNRAIQAACAAAAKRALAAAPPLPSPPPSTMLAGAVELLEHTASVPPAARASAGGKIGSHDNGSQPAAAVVAPAITVAGLDLQEYELPLQKPLTTGVASGLRRGALLRLRLTHGDTVLQGIGDMVPLPGFHRELYQDARAQAAALAELLPGCAVPSTVELLDGGMAAWWRDVVGVSTTSLWPSVQFAVESALLEALAARHNRSFAQQLLAACTPQAAGAGPVGGVEVNALLDIAYLTEQDAAHEAVVLKRSGFSCIKVKVGRTGEPLKDACRLAAIQRAVGKGTVLRADANRLYSREQALAFAQQLHLDGVLLEYIEEPLADPVSDLARFVEQTGLNVALDESLDAGELAAPMLRRSTPGAPLGLDAVAALVIKPSVLGSVERTCALLQWASAHGVACTVSSAFESAAGICKLAGIARVADHYNAARTGSELVVQQPRGHGLGTLSWFAADATAPLSIEAFGPAGALRRCAGFSAVAVEFAEAAALGNFSSCSAARRVEQRLSITVPQSDGADAVQYDARALVSSADVTACPRQPVLLLHGFMGSASDWGAVMEALAARGHDCAAVDLPGHGATITNTAGASISLLHMQHFVEAAVQSLDWGQRGVAVVGYSLGARIAMQVATAGQQGLVDRVVAISGSPGLQDPSAAHARLRKDVQTAEALRQMNLADFVDLWYAAPLWQSLRQHPRYLDVVHSRTESGDVNGLAAVLEGCSPGKQDLWGALQHGAIVCGVSFIVGEDDAKFMRIAALVSGSNKPAQLPGDGAVSAWPSADGRCSVVSIEGAGHALHVEQPLALIRALHNLL